MKREKALAVNTIMLGIGYVVPFVVNMLFLPVYTSKLSQEEYGVYDLISIISSLLITITTLRIHETGMLYLMKGRKSNSEEKIKCIITNVLSFVLVSSAIVFFLTLLVLRGLNGTTKVLIAVYFVVQVYIDTFNRLTRGVGRNKEYVIGVVIQTLGSFMLLISLITAYGASLDSILFANVISGIMVSIYLSLKVSIYADYKFKYFSISYTKEMLKFSIPIIFSSISVWIVKLSDRFVITMFLGAASNGIYAVANKIPNLLSQVFEVFNYAWQENAAITVDDKDSDAYYSRVFKTMFSVLIGMACALTGIVPFLFRILVKESFAEAYYQIPILIVAFFFACLNGYFGNIFFALGKQSINAYSTIIGAVINLTVCLALINKIGIYAASISTLISYMLLTIVEFFIVLKWKKMNYDYTGICVRLFMLILFCGISYVQDIVVQIINAVLAISFALIINKNLLQQIFQFVTDMVRRKKS